MGTASGSNCVFDAVPNGLFPFTQMLATDMDVSTADLFFVSCVPGSVQLGGAATRAIIDSYADKIQSGQHTLPVISFSGNSRQVTAPPADTFPWVIVLAAAGGGLLLLVLLIVICCCVRARRN